MTVTNYKKGDLAPAPLPIRTEEDVVSTWLTRGPPVVSVCCATYNHVAYLEDALRGFLAQVTSFPFEIIVRDDASTDGTTEILKDYAERYPSIIRTIIETQNQYSKGLGATYAMQPLARGEFVALCEGDDYWTSPTKLEQQVALLQANQQSTMCVAQTAQCRYEDSTLMCSDIYKGNEKFIQSFEDISVTYFHTSTYLIRTAILRELFDKFHGKVVFGDTSLRLMLIHYGSFVSLQEIVSVYRITGAGIWTKLGRYDQLAWEIKVRKSLYKYFDPKYKKYHGSYLSRLYGYVIKQDIKLRRISQLLTNLPLFVYFRIRYGIPGSLSKRYGQRRRFLRKR